MTNFMVVTISSAVYVDRFDQIEAAKKSNDKVIVIRNLQVPAGVLLDLQNLKPGTTLQFEGRVTFGYKEWKGPMVRISGKNIIVEGKPGHLIDGEGARWWDGLGGAGGKTKPTFIELKLDDSIVRNLHVKNTPVQMFTSSFCNNLLITNVNLDNEDGKSKGRNTDGFAVGLSKNVTVQNSRVYNQDDCFCCGAGSDIKFINNVCIGGNGISIGSMGNNRVVERVEARHCQVIDSFNGIRIKTRKNDKALVKDVTFDDITLKDIQQRGVIVHGNYPSWRPTDDPTDGCPIKNLVINNVRGTVKAGGANTWIWLANGVASGWKVSNVNVSGGKLKLPCKGLPAGIDKNFQERCGQI
uniref:endo-polygalacturonase n=1 Tax=Lygus lineolaris TaxID=50650 RepID=A0A126CR22_LYGLI|nr:polygalacturonase 15b [Lygus lineolaris]